MRGQFFKPHCDGADGLCSHSGFVQSRRLVTAFCPTNAYVLPPSICE